MRSFLEQRPDPKADDVPLTRREYQVLRHLAYGLSNREIGFSLEISIETVKEHVQNILRKLDMPDRTAVAVWAVKVAWSETEGGELSAGHDVRRQPSIRHFQKENRRVRQHRSRHRGWTGRADRTEVSRYRWCWSGANDRILLIPVALLCCSW